jgi:hypothetical protein
MYFFFSPVFQSSTFFCVVTMMMKKITPLVRWWSCLENKYTLRKTKQILKNDDREVFIILTHGFSMTYKKGNAKKINGCHFHFNYERRKKPFCPPDS